MCNNGQGAAWQSRILRKMNDETHILRVGKYSYDGLIVMFSDGTTAGYVVEELLSLRPDRELTHEPVEHKTPQNHTRPKRWAVATETVRLSEVSKNGSGRVH